MSERPGILTTSGLAVHFPQVRGVVWQRETGRVRAVNGVDVELGRGEILGLVGESGCGKSTLARAVLQLIRPTAGHVWYGGRDLTTLRGNDLLQTRRELQLIFQDPLASLNPRMRAGRIIAEPLRNFGVARGAEARERVAELMELVGLKAAWADGYPHEFSGGQRQRIAIARALSLEPKVLFCDEPVSALDVSIQAQVINLLKRLQRELDLSIVFISHDLSVVRHIADRVAVMYLGRIVELAPADALYTSPKHPYTRALLTAVPIPDPARERHRQRELLPGDPPSPLEEPVGCDFASRCPLARARCREQQPPLEEVSAGRRAACFYADEVEPPPALGEGRSVGH